jgi:hypothetical protein
MSFLDVVPYLTGIGDRSVSDDHEGGEEPPLLGPAVPPGVERLGSASGATSALTQLATPRSIWMSLMFPSR